MNQYQFKTWRSYLLEKHGGDIKSADSEYWNPPPLEIVLHYLRESRRAIEFEKENGITDAQGRGSTLERYAMDAIEADATGNPTQIAATFFRLGAYAESLDHLEPEQELKNNKARIAQIKSEAPLRHRGSKNDDLKEKVQDLAISYWDKDLDKEIRVTEMAKKVFDFANKEASKRGLLTVNNRSGKEENQSLKTIIEWLKADIRYPKHAKKEGRPKKKT